MKNLENQINEKDIVIKELESASSSQIQREEKSTFVDDNESLYDYKEENEKLLAEMEKLRMDYENMQRLNEQLKLESNEKENEYLKVKNDNNILRKSMEDLRKVQEEDLRRVQEENKVLKDERDEYKNDCEKLQEEKGSLIGNLKEMEEQQMVLNDREKKLEILLKENKDIKKKLDHSNDQIMRLKLDKKEAEMKAVKANSEISRLNRIISNQEGKLYDSGFESVDSEKTDSIIESPIIKTKTMVNVGVQCNLNRKPVSKKSSNTKIEDKYAGSEKWAKLATPKQQKPPHTMLSSYKNLTRHRSMSPIPYSTSPTPSNTSSNSSLSERPPWRLWSLYSKKN